MIGNFSQAELRRDNNEFMSIGADFYIVTKEIQQVLSKDGAPKFAVVVSKVFADTPAASAGMKTGDIILSLNNEKAFQYNQMLAIVENAPPTQPLRFKIARNKETVEVTVYAVNALLIRDSQFLEYYRMRHQYGLLLQRLKDNRFAGGNFMNPNAGASVDNGYLEALASLTKNYQAQCQQNGDTLQALKYEKMTSVFVKVNGLK